MDLWTIEPVTLTIDAPPAFTGTPSECWAWLVDFGRLYDFVGELQYVMDGRLDDAYPWGMPSLYSIRARYDTTFERYTGAMLWFLMYPAGGPNELPETERPFGAYRREYLKQAAYARNNLASYKQFWD